MEQGAGERVKEQAHTVVTVKTEVDKAAQSTTYREIQIDVNYTKEEPRLMKLVKSEPELLVNEEVVEDGWQGSELPIYICDICQKTYPSKSSVRSHIVCQHASRSYTCHQCNKIFKCKQYLMLHRATVHTAGSHSQLYRCSQCFKTYNSKRILAVHCNHVHVKESHKCTKCNKEFKCRAYLWHHVYRVHGEQRYECAVCETVFKYKYLMKKHIERLHASNTVGLQTQIHTCDFCQQTFSTKSELRKHKKNIHVSAHIHRCLRCNENFKSRDKLQQHKTSIHGKLQCEVCLRLYTSKSSLRQHVKRAHYSEDIQFKSDLRQHEMPDSQPTADVVNAADSTSTQKQNVIVVKEEPADGELELGPVVFQHMDCNFRPHKEEPQDGLGGLM